MEDANNSDEKRRRIRKTACALAIIGFFILVVYFRNPHDNTDATMPVSDSISIANNQVPAAVTAYISFVRQDTTGMSLEHSYSSDALMKLMAATSAEAEMADWDAHSSLTLVETYAERITQNRYADTHADDIREAAITLSRALRKIQERKFPQLSAEAASLVAAAEQINPKTLALDQRDVIKTFFSDAARLLEKMHSIDNSSIGFYERQTFKYQGMDFNA